MVIEISGQDMTQIVKLIQEAPNAKPDSRVTWVEGFLWGTEIEHVAAFVEYEGILQNFARDLFMVLHPHNGGIHYLLNALETELGYDAQQVIADIRSRYELAPRDAELLFHVSSVEPKPKE